MIGETVGNYRILGQLGAGGMGVVYFGEHVILGRRVALKVLRPEYFQDPEFATRFFNEARTTSLVRHPGLVEVFDFGTHPSGAPYLVMELLEGESLAVRRRREGRLTGWLTAVIVRQVAQAVGAAHAAGIVHRDLKPDNVFLVPERSAPAGILVKVLDFGLAKLSVEAMGGRDPRTRAGSMLGTPTYMSPEQCLGAAGVDYRTDIYSIGCMMFEMLAGRPPFVGQNLGEILAAHQRLAPPSLLHVDPTLPPALDHLFQRMMAKRPEDRPRSLHEVDGTLATISTMAGWDAFASLLTGSVPMPYASIVPAQNVVVSGERAMIPPPRPRRRKWPAVVAASVSAAVAALVVFMVTRGGVAPAAEEARPAATAPVAVAPPPPPPAAPKPAAAPPPAATPDAAPTVAESPPDAAPAVVEAAAPVVAADVGGAAPATRPVTFAIGSEPAGANVFDETGKPLGVTPLLIERPASDGEVSFVVRRRGFRDGKLMLRADRDGQANVSLEVLPRKVPARPKIDL